MAYSSKNARRGAILLLGAHLFACEPDPVELASISLAAVEIPSMPDVEREDPARALVVEPPPRRQPTAKRKRQTPREAPIEPAIEPPPAEYAAPPARELALAPVWAIPGAMPDEPKRAPAPTRVAARTYDPQALFGHDVRVERPRREWPFLPRPEGPRTARLTEVDVPMEVNIPLPRLRGPMIDIVEFDASGQHRPRITFRVERHQESGTGLVERQTSTGAPK